MMLRYILSGPTVYTLYAVGNFYRSRVQLLSECQHFASVAFKQSLIQNYLRNLESMIQSILPMLT